MNIKKIITFSSLRDQGASSLELQNDEVIQMKSKDKILCIIDQSYLLELEKIKQEYNKFSNHSFDVTSLIGSASSLVQKPQETKKLSNSFSVENRLSKLEKDFKNFLNNREK